MERHLDRRVEALRHVRDPDLRSHLHDVVLERMLADTDRAMVLRAGGPYRLVRTKPDAKPLNAQEKLLRAHATRRRPG